jgi:hypothetical protein
MLCNVVLLEGVFFCAKLRLLTQFQIRNGHGLGVVVATARGTEFGSIWGMMKDVESKKTPLQLKMEQLGKQLSLLSVSQHVCDRSASFS